ncbi:MAG: hypothetical protein ACYTGQ_01645 [Planctomycetota bacterium]
MPTPEKQPDTLSPEQAEAERIRQMIETGVRELDEGQTVDSEEVFKRLQARRDQLRREADPGS